MFNHIAVIGCGAIGQAMVNVLRHHYPEATLRTFNRSTHAPVGVSEHVTIDYQDEQQLSDAAHQCQDLDLVLITNGILHQDHIQPEKSIKDLTREQFHTVFDVNTITPLMIAKYWLPKLSKSKPAIFAALSARVGSIGDNQLGGWYAYRASKAALNMMIKNLSIEAQRMHPNQMVIGLHPGTVDSPLSSPFKARIHPDHIFTPMQSAEYLHQVLCNLKPENSGHCLDWQGQIIEH